MASATAASARQQPRVTSAFSGYYFGTGPVGIIWSLYVRPDGSGVFLGLNPNTGQPYLTPLTVASDGGFSAHGSGQAITSNDGGILSYAPEPYTISGQISGAGSVQATLSAFGAADGVLAGAADPTGGVNQAEAGYYVATGERAGDSTFYATVGPSGKVMAVDVGSAGTAGGTTGMLQGTTFSSGNTEPIYGFSLAPASHWIRVTVLSGNSQVDTFEGVADAYLSTARITRFAFGSEVGAGEQLEILGFEVGGSGTTGTLPALLRGLGPALAGPLSLPDPNLTLLQGSAVVQYNDNWGTDAAQINEISTLVDAPHYADSTSLDAALYAPALAPGIYTAELKGNHGSTGSGYAEVYDATVSPAASSPRLINLSARGYVGTSANPLAVSFTIEGSGSRTYLIRAIGPGLAVFGVSDPLPDPALELDGEDHAVPAVLAVNDNWGGTPVLAAAFGRAGAFPLDPGSKDAAVIVTLSAGDYGLEVDGGEGATGVALIEIYELP